MKERSRRKPVSIRAVIFDLDGTLAATGRDIADAVNEFRVRAGLKRLSLGGITRHVGQGVAHLLARTVPAAVLAGRPDPINEFRAMYLKRCVRHTRLFPGVSATLARLSHLKLAVATNKPRNSTERILRGLRVRKKFRVVLGGDDVKRKKPHPQIFLKAMSLLGVTFRETLVVGDSRFDIKAGRKAGCATCAVTYGFGSRRELARLRPDYTIRKFGALLKILGGKGDWEPPKAYSA